MGCSKSRDRRQVIMEKTLAKSAAEQLEILTRSLLSALKTHHAAAQWYGQHPNKPVSPPIDELRKKRTAELLDLFTGSLMAALYTYHAAMKWLDRVRRKTRKTPAEQLDLFTSSLLSALHTHHAASKWLKNTVRKSSDNADEESFKVTRKKSPTEQLDVFTKSLLAALHTYHAVIKWRERVLLAPFREDDDVDGISIPVPEEKDWKAEIEGEEELPSYTTKRRRSSERLYQVVNFSNHVDVFEVPTYSKDGESVAGGSQASSVNEDSEAEKLDGDDEDEQQKLLDEAEEDMELVVTEEYPLDEGEEPGIIEVTEVQEIQDDDEGAEPTNPVEGTENFNFTFNFTFMLVK